MIAVKVDGLSVDHAAALATAAAYGLQQRQIACMMPLGNLPQVVVDAAGQGLVDREAVVLDGAPEPDLPGECMRQRSIRMWRPSAEQDHVMARSTQRRD